MIHIIKYLLHKDLDLQINMSHPPSDHQFHRTLQNGDRQGIQIPDHMEWMASHDIIHLDLDLSLRLGLSSMNTYLQTLLADLSPYL